MSKSSQKAKNAIQQKHLVSPGELKVDNSLEQMFQTRENKYLLVNLIAKRGRDLNRGDVPTIQMPQPSTTTQTALAELESGKLKLIRKATNKVLVNLIESE